MLKCVSAAIFFACSLTSVSSAQVIPLEDATVGVPYSFDFGAKLSALSALGSGTDFSLTFSFGVSAGSGLPAGLTLSSSGLLSGTPTKAGNYDFTVDFAFTATVDGSTTAATLPTPESLNVLDHSGPPLAVNPGGLSFSVTAGDTAAVTQSIVIANSGSAAQTFTVTAAQDSGANWLSASPGSGTVAPFSSSGVSVNVDPTRLSAGTYRGAISITAAPSGQQFDIAVIVSVASGGPQLQLSQSGLFFQTVAGGGKPPSQSITVLNGGAGSLKFSAAPSTTAGGSDWLSVAPSSGTVTSSASASVIVSIDPSRLTAGDYYGQIEFSADGAVNSPLTATIVLHVASATTDLGATVTPTGLIFVGIAGGANPAAQTISVTNPSPSTLTFAAASFFGTKANNWFNVLPASSTVNDASPVQISVQPAIAGLAAGVYSGEIVLQFVEDNSAHHVAILLIVVPGGAAGKTSARATQPSACTPTTLLPVFTQLGSNFATVAAWPTPVAVAIVDDCGNPMTSGGVTASFSNGDPPLPLTSLQDGSWSATWQPRNSSAQVVVTVDALEIAPPIHGTQSIGGALQDNPMTPSVNAVVSAAKYASHQPLAPGAFASIYGVHLSAGQNPALRLPLDTQLGATQVVLGGRALPLQYAGDGQVNAIIPYDVPPNSTQQLIVTHGPALSVPQSIVIAPAQPAVFAQADGFGVVFDVKPGSTAQILVDANHPISAGDAIVIYCSGLGPVDSPVAAGEAAPSSPAANTKNPVTVTIGGKAAQVFFGGLVGGFAGLYQVNAYVPKGITAGDAVPLVVTVAGFDSAPVTVSVK